jgi:hypothetical protein
MLRVATYVARRVFRVRIACSNRYRCRLAVERKRCVPRCMPHAACHNDCGVASSVSCCALGCTAGGAAQLVERMMVFRHPLKRLISAIE